MKRLFFVEPVIALYTLPGMVDVLLIQQYIYRRIWENETNSSYIENGSNFSCHQNHSDPVYMKQQVIQGISSHFFMYMSLLQSIPGLIVTFILGTYSDHYGRRLSLLLPTVGSMLASLGILAVTYFSWPIYVIFIPVTLGACFGGFTALFGGAFAYVADISSSKQKNMRMALLDMIVGVIGGIGVLSSGYLLRTVGFNWLFLSTSLINFINIVYIIFFLEESIQVSRDEQDQVSGCDKFREILSGILILCTTSSFRKRVQIGMLLFAFSTFALVEFGAAGLFTLYELNTPLCWNEILIGYGSAAGLITFLTSFLGVTLFSRYLQDPCIVLIGMWSFVGGMIMAIFATTTLRMFLVRLVSLFAVMPFPVLRSMMSKLVSSKDQDSGSHWERGIAEITRSLWAAFFKVCNKCHYFSADCKIQVFVTYLLTFCTLSKLMIVALIGIENTYLFVIVLMFLLWKVASVLIAPLSIWHSKRFLTVYIASGFLSLALAGLARMDLFLQNKTVFMFQQLTKQGVLFACVACLENVGGTLSSTIFNNVYAATVEGFAGFSFLLAACLSLIPVCILCFLLCWKRQEEDYTRLEYQ